MEASMTQNKTLFCNGSDAGGCGKTICMVLIADWLKAIGIPRGYIDADPGNSGTARAFSHYLKGQDVRKLNVQDPEDLDAIFNLASQAGGPVLCDLPANASGNMASWWAEIATPDMFESQNTNLVTIIPVTNAPGSVQNALDWLETVGNQGTFIIALNRMNYALAPKPVKVVFSDWFAVAPAEYDIKTIEIGHLDHFAMRVLVDAQCLPSLVSADVLVEKRIKSWAANVHKQLDAAAIL